MVVHPAKGNSHGTLVNALLYHCKKLPRANEETRPGVVHRLDKETTGLLVFGKTDYTLRGLMTQLEKRRMTRKYLAITWGRIPVKSGMIEAPIGRHQLDRRQMTVTPLRSRTALTHFKVLERSSIASYLELRLETGRTHQIRVHLAHQGFPVLGDPTYGGRKKGLIKGLIQSYESAPHQNRLADVEKAMDQILLIISRQALHAATLGFHHPGKNEWMEFNAPQPEDMTRVLEFLRKFSTQ